MPPPPRDWSSLPLELLDAISRKIVLIADYLGFRAVCVEWRSASAPRPLHLPPQPPWLLLPYDPSPSSPDSVRLFLSLPSTPNPPRIHRFHLPDTRGFSCRGSSRGCLVLQASDGPAVRLLNPITKTLIHLPPLSSMTFSSTLHPYPPRRSSYMRYVIKKAVLSSDPFTDPRFVVMLLVGLGELLVFFRGGDASWTVADLHTAEQRFVDVAYQGGKFYAVGNRGRVTAYDLASPSPSKDVVDSVFFGEDHKYLVERASGELLMVVWDFRRYGSGDGAEYRVFKLSLEGQPEWLEVNDVGEEALLLGGNESRSNCLSICCTAYSGLWRRNCLYYTFPHFIQPVEDGDLAGYGINLLRLEDGGIEQVVHNSCICSLNWPPALWFTPNLC